MSNGCMTNGCMTNGCKPLAERGSLLKQTEEGATGLRRFFGVVWGLNPREWGNWFMFLSLLRWGCDGWAAHPQQQLNRRIELGNSIDHLNLNCLTEGAWPVYDW